MRFQFVRRIGAAVMCCGAAVALSAFGTAPAHAVLQLCNGTPSRVGVAIGYKDTDGNWVTEGWWNLPPHGCGAVLKETLAARFYYVYAIDYDHGGEWAGSAFMCTREKEFKIVGIEDCLARGYDRTGFYEIDTGEQRSWTIQFTEAAQQQGPPQPGTSLVPALTGRPSAPANQPPGNQNR